MKSRISLFGILLLLALPMGLMAESKGIDYLNDSNFGKTVKDQVYVVDFYADWCGPCRAFAPTFEKVAENLTEFKFAQINVDKSPQTSTDYKIQFIPYVVVLKDGVVMEQYEGNRTEEDFVKWVKKVNKKYGI